MDHGFIGFGMLGFEGTKEGAWVSGTEVAGGRGMVRGEAGGAAGMLWGALGVSRQRGFGIQGRGALGGSRQRECSGEPVWSLEKSEQPKR